MEEGHNVAVITRGIDDAIGPYFETVLGVTPIMNEYKKGSLSIYAPDEDTFYANKESSFWALKKTEFVADIIDKIGSSSDGKKSIFMDDTEENVLAMKVKFPHMVCEVAEAGEYESTFAKVNSFLPKVGGMRKNFKLKIKRRQTRRKLKTL
jgi:hypothetical protein